MDLWTRCKPIKLMVYARYTRRGGLDINPLRTSHPQALPPTCARRGSEGWVALSGTAQIEPVAAQLMAPVLATAPGDIEAGEQHAHTTQGCAPPLVKQVGGKPTHPTPLSQKVRTASHKWYSKGWSAL